MKRIFAAMFFAMITMPVLAAGNFGNFTEEQVCIAGIATNNGRAAKGIQVLGKQNGVISVAYMRDDGKPFAYRCDIQGSQILWRDQSMSGWSKNIKLFFAVSSNGAQLNVRSEAFGESYSKSFSLTDF
jgi:hypothetical protein